MLRIQPPSKSPSQVQHYFEHSDYYAQGPDALKGYWFGKAGEMLGLASGSEIVKTQFDRVIANQHPFREENITPRTRSDRRVGWDVTFSTPKSVSIAWALSGDDRILDAVRDAVNDTLAEMEKDVMTRVHVGRKMHTEKIGNMIAGTWLHKDARPEEHSIPMPQLHVHAFIANIGWTGDGFKAIDISALKHSAPLYEARFHSRLASNLQERFGFGIERQGRKWFEIRGFDRALIERYSERTSQIEQTALDKGITDPVQKAQLGAKTRERKSMEYSLSELRSLWRNRLSDNEFQALRDAVKRGASSEPLQSSKAAMAVDYAIENRFARDATVRERSLLTDAIWRGIGEASVGQIDDEFEKRRFIRDGHDEHAWVTTPKVQKEEQAILRFAKQGLNQLPPLAEHATIHHAWLSDEQQHAIKQLWQSRDRVMILVGKAGVGKTTSALELVEGIQRHGHEVTMLAPTTKAVGVLKQDGFRAGTLQSFLKSKAKQQEAAGNVIYVDEAGLVSSIDMASLFRVAEENNTRVILAGDRFQHAPVERGRPLELLELESGIKPASIHTIRRQEDRRYREAVQQLSRGEVNRGFDSLREMGAIQELPDALRYKALAAAYANAMEEGQSAMVISPTHAEKRVVNEAIRDELQRRGRLGSGEHEITTYSRYDWTVAERQDARLYSPGDMIEFRTRGKNGFQPGERAVVTQTVDGRVEVERASGDIAELPLSSAGGFSVFRPEVKRFAVGDKIRITQNRRGSAKQPRLTNGKGYIIHGFTKDGMLRLGDGVTLSPTWGHIDHNWVSTSYSGQGDQSDKMFVAQSRASFPASSPRQAYVSVSRGKTEICVYTDDADGLREAILRDRSVRSATELSGNAKIYRPPSRIKQQIHRLRHIAALSRDFMSRQIERIQQLRHRPAQVVASR